MKYDEMLLALKNPDIMGEKESELISRYILRMESFKDIVVGELEKMPPSSARDLLLRVAELTD